MGTQSRPDRRAEEPTGLATGVLSVGSVLLTTFGLYFLYKRLTGHVLAPRQAVFN